MLTEILLLIYSLILVLLSLLGGWLPTLWKWTHIRIQLVMSLIAGFMLGIAFVQLLPHSIRIINQTTTVGITMLAGLLTMFFMIRIFDFHHHHFPGTDNSEVDGHHGCQHEHDHDHDHQVAKENVPGLTEDLVALSSHGEAVAEEVTLTCAHDHSSGEHQHLTDHSFAWMGLLFGLALHSLMDGMALAASMRIDQNSLLAGLGIFLAIALHKPLDSMSIVSVMSFSQANRQQQRLVNLAFALSCPLAAALFYFGFSYLPADTTMALGFALAFSAGTFLCISLGDLLPELHFHTHDRFKLSIALMAGIALAILIEFMPLHTHSS